MRKSLDNSETLAAFIAHKAEIDAILACLAALSADHFTQAPDDITWANVGTVGSYLKDSARSAMPLPRRRTDSLT